MPEREPIISIDTWRIREGKLDAFKDAAQAFVDFAAENEPQLIAYNVYVDEETNQSTVVQIHPDPESIEFHLEVAGPQFGRFMEIFEPGGRIEVHGKPADHVLERMRQIAKQFGVTVAVMERYAGFARLLR